MKTRVYIIIILFACFSQFVSAQFSNWVRNAYSVRKSQSLGVSTDFSGNVYTYDVIDTYESWGGGSAQTTPYPYYVSNYPEALFCISKFTPEGVPVWHKYFQYPPGYNAYSGSSGPSCSGTMNATTPGFGIPDKFLGVIDDKLFVTCNFPAGSTLDGATSLPSGDVLLSFDLSGNLLSSEVLNFNLSRCEIADQKLLIYGRNSAGTIGYYQVRNSINQVLYSGQVNTNLRCNSLSFYNGVLFAAGYANSLSFGSSSFTSVGNKIIGLDLINN